MNRQAIARRGKHLEHFTIALLVVSLIANEGGEARCAAISMDEPESWKLN
jgi:hypothetical protein